MKLLLILSVCVFSLNSFTKNYSQEFVIFNQDKACGPGEDALITAVGDLLMHSPLQKKAVKHQDFSVLWKEFEHNFFGSNIISYANLETPTAKGINVYGNKVKDPGFKFDGYVYTTFPQFNTSPYLIRDLKNSGFDILSTANNHSLDHQSEGANATIDALELYDMNYMGTIRSKTGPRAENWYTTFTTDNGISTAWIACTYDTNGIKDSFNQVLHCFKEDHHKFIIELIKNLSKKFDAVIVTPHWGVEKANYPNTTQKKYGKEYLEAGALVVIGNHPHVLQPMEKHITKDDRETFIIYSLGNFISFQGSINQRTTGVLFIGLKKPSFPYFSKVVVSGVKIMPGYMNIHEGQDKLYLETIPENPTKYQHVEGLKIVKKLFNEKNIVYNYSKVIPNSECYND